MFDRNAFIITFLLIRQFKSVVDRILVSHQSKTSLLQIAWNLRWPPLIGIKIAKGQPPIFPYIMLKTSSNLIYVTVCYLLLDRLPTFLLRRIA